MSAGAGSSTALVVGAEGTIGGALHRRLSEEGVAVVATSREGIEGTRRLDLATDVALFPLPSKVDGAFICAGVTNLARCEEAAVESARINVERTVELAGRLIARGAFVLFPSTNLVFDGSVSHVAADSPVGPTLEYGRQKAEAERRLLSIGEGVAILRLTKVVHPALALFREWRRALLAGEPIYPFSDLLFAPVSLERVVESLLRIAERRVGGVFQLSADRDVSYEMAARRLAEVLRIDPALVRPRRAAEAGIPAARITPHSTLDGGRLARELAIEPPSADQTLDALFSMMKREVA